MKYNLYTLFQFILIEKYMCMLIAKGNKLIIRKFLSILILAIHLRQWDEYE